MTVVDVLLCVLALCVFCLLVLTACLMHAEDDPYDGGDEFEVWDLLYGEPPLERRATPQQPPRSAA